MKFSSIIDMSSNNLTKEEQQKINNQLNKELNKPVFSLDNFRNQHREEPVYEDESYMNESYIDDRDYKSIQLDFKTLRELFVKEQQLYKLEDKSRYQTLDISNLTLKVTELEEKIGELETENENNRHLVDLIENTIKFHNKDSNTFKTRNSNSIFDIQNNITEIEIAFRKVEKDYNQIIKDISSVESEELKRYLNSIVTVKFHNILEIYNKRYSILNNINLQKNIVNVVSLLVMLFSVIYSLIKLN